ncbi:hypothetical protein C9374_004361 [Naegleria lovaniensis]|uniref:Uncharacterized protein n=1 Tax=Naegleria lovaniensis TaxID=51637 RepID=A0AA88KLI6_NAELO|nr:uncharacterized protein C9374_004361 [Naegleria lovaniensis]KAG2383690.1 hypothetical protein C9374_004361 [Naegleria lovaniensis]
MFLSHLRHKHSAFRWNAPNINGATSALSTAYLLVANEDESSSSRLEFGLTVTISQFALRGGTIAFLVLFGIVVFGIVLLIIAVALVHCVSKRNENREAKEKEQQEEAHNKIEMTPIHYHKMTDEEEV